MLERKQLGDLKEIVQFAYDRAPYYKRSFDDAGLKPSDIQSLDDIERVPYVHKKTQRNSQGVGSFLGELAAVPEEDVVFVSTSSGSTGVPTMSPFTKRDFDEWQDVESRLFWMAGMRKNDRYIHALNLSLYVGGPDVIGAQNLGALCIWGGTLPSERLIFILKEYQPTAIWTSPSYALYLGDTAKKTGVDPKRDFAIKRIFVAGEMGGSISVTRQSIEELWGAVLYDFYGLSDIFGACAAMCEHHDGLHIAEDHILVETVDLDAPPRGPSGLLSPLAGRPAPATPLQSPEHPVQLGGAELGEPSDDHCHDQAAPLRGGLRRWALTRRIRPELHDDDNGPIIDRHASRSRAWRRARRCVEGR